MTGKSLNILISEFFEATPVEGRLAEHSLFICRRDGVLLYDHNLNQTDLNKTSMGALVGGVWQAAKSLIDFLANSSGSEFRLSFDSSQQGFYILPIDLNGEEYYFGLIFDSELNPALVKNKHRKTAELLARYIETMEDEIELEKKTTEFLFDDISDEEMDNLFAF